LKQKLSCQLTLKKELKTTLSNTIELANKEDTGVKASKPSQFIFLQILEGVALSNIRMVTKQVRFQKKMNVMIRWSKK